MRRSRGYVLEDHIVFIGLQGTGEQLSGLIELLWFYRTKKIKICCFYTSTLCLQLKREVTLTRSLDMDFEFLYINRYFLDKSFTQKHKCLLTEHRTVQDNTNTSILYISGAFRSTSIKIKFTLQTQ